MTVHAAKGLEFPITVLSGMTTRPITAYSNSVVWHDDTWTISNAKSPDPIFEDFKPIDEQMSDAERRRLLYVACTRAVDHLVVSLHRYPGDDGTAANSVSGALLFGAGAAHGNGARVLEPVVGSFERPQHGHEAPAWSDHDEWDGERRRAFAAARRRPTVSATYLAGEADTDPGLDKGAVDLDLPPWQRGRYGTAVGRAVARGAAVRRLRHRRQHRCRGGGAVCGRGHRRHERHRGDVGSLRAGGTDRATSDRSAPSPRAVRGRAGRRANRRGVHRPVRRVARRRHHRRLQDRSVARRRRAGPTHRPVPAPAGGVRRGARANPASVR